MAKKRASSKVVGDSTIRNEIIVCRGKIADVARKCGYTRPSMWRRIRNTPMLRETLDEVLQNLKDAGISTRTTRTDAKATDDQIEAQLRLNHGRVGFTARALGMTAKALRRRLENNEALQIVIEEIEQIVRDEAFLRVVAHMQSTKADGSLTAAFRLMDLGMTQSRNINITGNITTRRDPAEIAMETAQKLAQLEQFEAEHGIAAAMAVDEE